MWMVRLPMDIGVLALTGGITGGVAGVTHVAARSRVNMIAVAAIAVTVEYSTRHVN